MFGVLIWRKCGNGVVDETAASVHLSQVLVLCMWRSVDVVGRHRRTADASQAGQRAALIRCWAHTQPLVFPFLKSLASVRANSMADAALSEF